MDRRNVVLGSVAVVALALAAYFFVFAGGPETEIADHVGTHGVCLSCRWEGLAKHPAQEIPPHTCPDCGQPAFYPYFYCPQCHARFVPRLFRTEREGPLRVPPMPTCPVCGNPGPWVYIPEMVEGEELHDQPLPRWP